VTDGPEEQLPSPGPTDRIDQLLKLSQPKAWISLICVLLLLGAFGVWAFVGKIPVQVTGRGVLLNARGVFSVEAPAAGTLTELFVKQGDIVSQGQRIATIYNSQRQAILRNIEVGEFKIEKMQLQLKLLQDRLQDREKLFKEGLIPKTTLEETRQALITQQIAEEEAKGSLATLHSDLEKISASVIAPHDGKVLELFVSVGDIIEKKEPLIWMEYPLVAGENRLLYCCVPTQTGHIITPDLRVQIEPITVNTQEYGAMGGTVRDVSAFTTSEAELFNDLRNKQLVAYLTQGAPSVSFLSVDPTADAKTPTGFSWTSGQGPPFPLPSGTLAVIKIVVDEQPPISYLIPLWKLTPSSKP
jgi:HlyD family secretion protein